MEEIRIIFSPTARGAVWLGMSRNQVASGVAVKNLQSLVEFIEFRCGIHRPDIAPAERLMSYMESMRSSVAGTIYNKSFEIDELGVAKACLALRDELMMLGWTPDMRTGVGRIDDLSSFEAGADDRFKCSISERIDALIEKKPKLSGIVIELPVKKEYLPKKVRALLGSLMDATIVEAGAADIHDNDLGALRRWLADPEKNNFGPKHDGSLEIWKFADEVEAMDYLAAIPDDEFGLWLNEDNMMLDSWMKAAGFNTSGATNYESGTPIVMQLFRLAMGVVVRPYDPTRLLGFLSNPECPLKDHWKMASQLLHDGGCGKWDKQFGGMLAPDGRVSHKAMEGFMDFIVNKLQARVSQKQIRPAVKQQLEAIIPLFDAVLRLMQRQSGDIPVSVVDMWAEELPAVSDNILIPAETGCRVAIGCPGNMLRPTDSTIWVSAGDYKPANAALLSDAELNALSAAGCAYIEDACGRQTAAEMETARERDMANAIYLLPLTMTSGKLVLVDIERVSDSDKPASPLLVRLYNFAKFDDDDCNPLVVRKNLKEEFCKDAGRFGGRVSLSPAETIGNIEIEQDENGMVNVIEPSEIQWRSPESPSSLESFIQDPLEYVFRYLLEFEPEDKNRLPKINIVKGNVAHETIQRLFCVERVKNVAQLDALFDAVFDEVLYDHGIVLLQPVNASALVRFRKNVHQSALHLLEILDKNGLEPDGESAGFEVKVNDEGKILHRDGCKDVAVEGRIDFLVQRKDNPMRKVVIDFKYTAHPENYYNLLDNARAIQLVLYKKALEAMGKTVEGTAYFLMSDKDNGELHSSDDIFAPGTFKLHASMDYDEIATKVCNSYWTRRGEIEAGRIELGEDGAEGMIATLIDYYNKYVSQGEELLPLKVKKTKEGVRKQKPFTNYGSLK